MVVITARPRLVTKHGISIWGINRKSKGPGVKPGNRIFLLVLISDAIFSQLYFITDGCVASTLISVLVNFAEKGCPKSTLPETLKFGVGAA